MFTSEPADVVVLDYGAGNIRSVVRALERAGARVTISDNPDRALSAQGLVVPGVGAFASVMQGLSDISALEVIRQRHEQGLPLLGICVGLQVFFTTGTEHGISVAGIGLWPGEITVLDARIRPLMGWLPIEPDPGMCMFEGVEKERFYFVHSFAAHTSPENSRVAWGKYDTPFIAAVEDKATWAVQFHPEKSGDAGAVLFQRWITQAVLRRGQ